MNFGYFKLLDILSKKQKSYFMSCKVGSDHFDWLHCEGIAHRRLAKEILCKNMKYSKNSKFMQIRLKAVKNNCECETKIEGPLRLADYGFGPPRHIIDHIKKEIAIQIILEIAIFLP